MRVYLLGFMGCGKSTVGKQIAKELGWEFIETDKLISKTSNLSIKEIFKTLGENTFRNFESNILENIAKQNESSNMIISTGGGLPCNDNNISIIKESGISIYIKLSEEILTERLKKGKDKRPVISNTPDEQLDIQIKQLMKERSKYYEESDEIIICDRISTNEIVSIIVNIIKKYQD